MVNCYVQGCKSRGERKEPKITFHRFPSEPLLRSQWIEFTGRVNWYPCETARICSLHFKSSCFRRKLNRRHLNTDSIPTLLIQEDDSSIADEELSSEEFPTQIRDTVSQIPPRTKLLIRKLEKETKLSEKRRKIIAMLRAKIWRLEKKTEAQCSIIEELKTFSLINRETTELLYSVQATNEEFYRNFICKNNMERQEQKLKIRSKEPPTQAIFEGGIIPHEDQLMRQLEKKTITNENRRKTLATFKSKLWRLERKAEKQSSMIAELTHSLLNQKRRH